MAIHSVLLLFLFLIGCMAFGGVSKQMHRHPVQQTGSWDARRSMVRPLVTRFVVLALA